MCFTILAFHACKNTPEKITKIDTSQLIGTWYNPNELFTISDKGFYQNKAVNGTTDYGEYRYDGISFGLQVFTHKHDRKINPTFQVLALNQDTFKLSSGKNAWYYLRSSDKQLSPKALQTAWTKRHEYYIYGTWKNKDGDTLIFDDFNIMQHSTNDSSHIGCYAILGNVVNFDCKNSDVSNFYSIEIEAEKELRLTNINTKNTTVYKFVSAPQWNPENKRIAAPYAIDSPDKRIYFFKNKARIGKLVDVYQSL